MATKKTGNKNSNPTGRPKPLTPKAGFTRTKRRYGCGGKLKKQFT